jgi:glutaminyl-peptide cyclotransferase
MAEASPIFVAASPATTVRSGPANLLPIARRFAARGAMLLGLGLVFAESRALAQTATPRVEAIYPHDTTAFTEGLELFEGKLFESTGLTGKSVLRRVAYPTGTIEKNIDLDSSLFGEGLTRVDRTLIQLTYTTGVAIVYNLDTFAEIKRFTYTGQGWGLCYDGTDLVMSNGTDKLVFRDPVTFATRREVTVRRNGTAIDNLNELECVGSLVYINEWKTDDILRVDKATGNVLTLIDASTLLTAEEKKNVDVLNGIAYDQSKGRFYLTGKYWPKLFEVSFDFSPGGDTDGGVADAGGADAGGSVDAGGAIDAGSDASIPRDAASDRATSDGPRDVGATRDAEGGGARDATASDTMSADATVPPPDGTVFPDSGNGQGGTAGAGGSSGDPGGGTAQESCACRAGGAPTSRSWPAITALVATFTLARARRRHTS